MRTPPDLDRRLEAYFASLRAYPLRERLKRSPANWQIYAAVSSSAMAMLTSAAAAQLGSGVPDLAPEGPASVRTARTITSAKNIAFRNAVGFAALKPAATQGQTPSISPGGVVPIFSTVNAIQPGEWVSIYGSNLAAQTFMWKGDFPTSLGGTTVEINGKLAYLMYVSPGLINLQAPDDTATGTVSVVVTTAAGSVTSSVVLTLAAPSFTLADSKHVSGIILRADGSGAFGGGSLRHSGPHRHCVGL